MYMWKKTHSFLFRHSVWNCVKHLVGKGENAEDGCNNQWQSLQSNKCIWFGNPSTTLTNVTENLGQHPINHKHGSNYLVDSESAFWMLSSVWSIYMRPRSQQRLDGLCRVSEGPAGMHHELSALCAAHDGTGRLLQQLHTKSKVQHWDQWGSLRWF